jgi:tellurite resistance protein
MSKNKPTKEKLAEYADEVRKELSFRGQDELFGLAVEAGHLAAKADGSVDASELQAIVAAIDVLSQGTVIELEVESIIQASDAAGGSDLDKAEGVGKRLGELGQAEAGLLLAAFVAQAVGGIDAAERKVLRAVGKAAGIGEAKIRRILKVVGAEAPEGG